MPQRHKWVRLREHVYICRTCGCGKVNTLTGTPSFWETTYHTPDGQSRVLSHTPACALGPKSEAYLAKHALDIALWDAEGCVQRKPKISEDSC